VLINKLDAIAMLFTCNSRTNDAAQHFLVLLFIVLKSAFILS